MAYCLLSTNNIDRHLYDETIKKKEGREASQKKLHLHKEN